MQVGRDLVRSLLARSSAQPPAQSRVSSCLGILLRAVSDGPWKTSEARDYTAFLSHLPHCLAAHTCKSFSFYKSESVLFQFMTSICCFPAMHLHKETGSIPLKAFLHVSSLGKHPPSWLSSDGGFSCYQLLSCIGRPKTACSIQMQPNVCWVKRVLAG